jgi:hypothetical protein
MKCLEILAINMIIADGQFSFIRPGDYFFKIIFKGK